MGKGSILWTRGGLWAKPNYTEIFVGPSPERRYTQFESGRAASSAITAKRDYCEWPNVLNCPTRQPFTESLNDPLHERLAWCFLEMHAALWGRPTIDAI